MTKTILSLLLLLQLVTMLEKSATEAITAATFNVLGLTSKFKQNCLLNDVCNFNFDFCLIQETKCSENATFQDIRYKLVLTNCDKFYGLGLAYNSVKFSLIQVKEYGKRVCYYQLMHNQDKGKKIDIINVYGPTNILAKTNQKESSDFNGNLTSCLKNFKSNLWFIGGDFNSKFGNKQSEIQGSHSKECQNENGIKLEEFMQEHTLYATNTTFKKKSKHKTTWTGYLKGKTVYNVIDFILIHQRLKKFLIDTNTYLGTLTQSDHKLLITKIKQTKSCKCWTNRKSQNKFDFSSCNHQNKFKQKMEKLGSDSFHNILKNTKETSHSCFSLVKKKTSNIRYNDKDIENLARHQKDLRNLIECCKDPENCKALEMQRNEIKRTIKRKCIEICNKELESKLKIIESLDYNRQMHAAIKELNIRPKNSATCIQMKNLVDHYQKKFGTADNSHHQKWNPEMLNYPFKKIQVSEVEIAISKLKVNKSPGNRISPEEFKSLGEKAINMLFTALNQAIQDNKYELFNHGIIIPIPKKGKASNAANTRPITSLNTTRKILSIIILERIRLFAEEYLPNSQAAYRPTRSTTDIVWAHKIAVEQALKIKSKLKISGIDLSSAFDTINRKKLFETHESMIPFS